MLSELALWMNANATPILFTGLTMQAICIWAIQKGASFSSIIFPANLSLVMVLVVDALPFFMPTKSGTTAGLLASILTTAMFWMLWKINSAYYRHRQRQKKVDRTLIFAVPTLLLLSHLFAEGKLVTLDSETTDEREKPLTLALEESLCVADVFSSGALWSLVNCSVPGRRTDTLKLIVAKEPLSDDKVEKVAVQTIFINFLYKDGGLDDITFALGAEGMARITLKHPKGLAPYRTVSIDG